MNLLRKIALPCGIAGCCYMFLLSAIVFLTLPIASVISDGSGQTIETLTLIEQPPLLFIPAVILIIMSLLTILVMLLLKRKPLLRTILIWISIAVTFVSGLFILRQLILPATVLLVVAAIGMEKGSNPLEQKTE